MPNRDFTQNLARLTDAEGLEKEKLPEDLMPVVYDELRAGDLLLRSLQGREIFCLSLED